MEIQINTHYRLYIVGEITIQGLLPETRRLLNPSTAFKIVDGDGNDIVLAKVLKSNWKAVEDVVARRADEAATLTLRAEILCDIEYCHFFEPL